MTETKTTERLSVSDVIERYGECLELVPMDPHFHDISVGIYVKDGTCTVWTFSRKPGVEERIWKIRDQIVALGGLAPVKRSHNQIKFPCEYIHMRPLKFLMAQAVGKDPDYSLPTGDMSIKDTKTKLMLSIGGRGGGRKVGLSGVGRGRGPEYPDAAPTVGCRLCALRRDGKGERHRGGVPLRSTPRRAHPAGAALLPERERRREHDGG